MSPAIGLKIKNATPAAINTAPSSVVLSANLSKINPFMFVSYDMTEAR